MDSHCLRKIKGAIKTARLEAHRLHRGGIIITPEGSAVEDTHKTLRKSSLEVYQKLQRKKRSDGSFRNTAQWYECV